MNVHENWPQYPAPPIFPLPGVDSPVPPVFVPTPTPVATPPVPTPPVATPPVGQPTPDAEQSTPQPVTRPETVSVWGTDFAKVDMSAAIDLADRIVQAGCPEYFVTANLNYLMLTDQYPRLQEINQRSCAVIADGYPIVHRSRLTSTPLPARVTGSDMIVELAGLCAARGYRMFFLGAAPGVGAKAAAELQRLSPGLQIAGCYSPPFRQLTSAEHEDLLQRIRDAQPDILLVAFGQPKGETWIYDNYQALGVPLSIQLGASFDFLAGTARRAPALLQHLGCEWLFRSFCEPKRLLPRYIANFGFLLKLLLRDMLGQHARQNAAADKSSPSRITT